MDKVVLLALVGCLVGVQVLGRPSNKKKSDDYNGFYDYMYDGDFYKNDPYPGDKRITWDKVKAKVEKIDKPVDPDPYNKHYRKQVDVDPNNAWMEVGKASSEEWSGVDPNSVGDWMVDDQETSGGQWTLGDDEDGYDDTTYYDEKRVLENEVDYIEDDVRINEDRIYELEDDLTFDEKKIKKMEKQMKKMKKKMKSLQKLVGAIENNTGKDAQYVWQEVESKYESRPRRGRYYDLPQYQE